MSHRYSSNHKDMRPFIGAGWWEDSIISYNKDGSIYQKTISSPSKFYTQMVLKPTTNLEVFIMAEWSIAIIIAIVIFL